MKAPVVPLNIAEFIRVTLQIAKQSHSLNEEQKRHIGQVLAVYELERDEYLLNQGFTQKQIAGFAESAALALANYLEDKASEVQQSGVALLDNDIDMSEFERDLSDHSEDSKGS